MKYHCEYTELVDPNILRPHPKNANKHPNSQVKQLFEVIERIGWRLPIVVSKLSGCIVAGHCRQLAGLALNCEVPVDYQDFASETEELDFLMADNLVPELAKWDTKLKLANLELLKLEDISFDVETISNEISIEPEKILIVEVICSSEEEQAAAYDLLTREGYNCKVMGI